MSGIVYLVGSGPGDPGLLTVRAMEVLGRADVVLHDRLIPREALDAVREDAELIDVGKIGGGPQVPQEETASQEGPRRGGGRGSSQKARKSQIDLLRTLAEELRGENGVARLESRIGKQLAELSRAEADEWIDRLTPAEGRE